MKKKIILFLYGIIVAKLIYYYAYNILNEIIYVYMPTRLNLLSNTLEENNIIKFCNNIFYINDHSTSFYFYAWIYGKIFNIIDPKQIFYDIQYIFMFILLACIPVIIYELYHSMYLSLVSPILFYLVMEKELYHFFNDSYWIYSWSAIIVAFALSLLYIKKNNIYSVILFLFITFSVSNVIRGESATLLAFFVIIIIGKYIFNELKNKNKLNKKYIIMIFMLLLSTQIFTNIIPNAFLKNNINRTLQSFGPWHTLYIGLGWETAKPNSFIYKENKYRIYWGDQCAIDFVKNKNRNIEVYSKEYFDTLKYEYVSVFINDSYFFISTYVKKFIVGIFVAFFTALKDNLFFMILIFFMGIYIYTFTKN